MPQICKRCLYTETHPLGIVFDDDGICSGCRIHEKRTILTGITGGNFSVTWWSHIGRRNTLVTTAIIPVTGAADSYYIVDSVKNGLGLNPLLVNYNRYYNTPLGIRNLANLRINSIVTFCIRT